MIRPSPLKPLLPDPGHHDADTHIHPPIFPTVEFLAPQRSRWCWRTGGVAYNHSLLGRLMTEMPIDILFEIFGHLTPADLLMLSRTTTALRALLMSRSSISVWRASIASVPGLPACPLDLTEPQYANLAFDDHCHFCLTPNVHDIFWGCRLRACRKCVQKHFISDHDLRKRYPHEPGDYRYSTVFPYIVYPSMCTTVMSLLSTQSV
ncbi:hypothetical protein BD779DRAFT_584279 [Infundibulicybe gibba]|nr:hypothetical protein BD779DRAFT_584279 [Infundibulicybe gibba]